MLEFIRIDPAPIWPHRCASCQSYKALADTHVEIPGYGRLYLCKLCASRLARVFGLVKGNEMDELMNADGRLRQAEKELAERDELLERLRTEGTQWSARAAQLEEERDQLAGRIEQLEATIRTEAEMQLALVGAGTSYSTTTNSPSLAEENDGTQEQDGSDSEEH